MRAEWLPLLFAAGAAKRIGFGPLRENEYPAAKWMQAHTTAAAELVPASVQVDFTKGERCVLAHEGVTLRRAAQLAAADGCMAGDEETELYKRRCAVHHQPRAQRADLLPQAAVLHVEQLRKDGARRDFRTARWRCELRGLDR